MNAHKWPRTLTRPACPVETMNLTRMQSAMVQHGRAPRIEEVHAAMREREAQQAIDRAIAAAEVALTAWHKSRNLQEQEGRAAMYARDAANDAPSESDYAEAAEFEFYGTAHAAG